MLAGRRSTLCALAGIFLVSVTVGTSSPLAVEKRRLDRILRPTNPRSEFAYSHNRPAQYEGSSVVVHYVTRSPDSPPLTDRNHDGVPDYVELVAELADDAIAFYKHPRTCVADRCFPAQQGFKAPRHDQGGPDGKPDIYIKAGIPSMGETLPPGRAEGGSFILLRPRLDQRPINPRNGLHIIVPHEVFHLVEYSYVASGAPRWISEGVANAMAAASANAWYVAHHITSGTADSAVQAQFDQWLKQPWLSVFSDEFVCDRCYGTLVWWGRVLAKYNQLQRFFQLLGQRPQSVGLGVGLLDQAIEETGGLFGERTFGDALGNFWEEMYRGNSVATLSPLVASSTERSVGPSSPSQAEPPLPGLTAGLSAHFVRIVVPAEAQGIHLVLETDGGLAPRMALFLGGNFVTGRSSRRVDPLRTEPAPFSGRSGQMITLDASFRDVFEQGEVVLMVVNRRTSGLRYRLRYVTTGAPIPAGRYCGITERQGPDFCLDRSADGSSISEVRTRIRVDQCTPAASFYLPVALHPSVPLDGQGHFTAHYTLSGNGSGVVDLAGSLDSSGKGSGTIQMVRATLESEGTHYECTGRPIKWNVQRVQ